MLNPATLAAPRVPPEQAAAYLRKRARSELIGNIAGAVLSLAGAALVFFGVVFFSFILSLNLSGHESQTWIWVAMGICAFAFVAYAFTDPEYLSKLEVFTVDGRPAYSIPLPGGWRLSNVDYTNPRTAASLAKIILQLLTAGPRALVASWRYATRAAALRRVEPGALTSMFQVLVQGAARYRAGRSAAAAFRMRNSRGLRCASRQRLSPISCCWTSRNHSRTRRRGS